MNQGHPQNRVPDICLKLLKGCKRYFINLAHSDIREISECVGNIFVESFSTDNSFFKKIFFIGLN